MSRLLPPRRAAGMHWRHTDGTPETRGDAGALPSVLTAPPPPLPVAQRAELSPGARLLFSALRRGDYVVCIDPRQLARTLGVSERKLQSCLGELRRAGVIAEWWGNLVFFP